MKIYTQGYKCSKSFPINFGDQWSVREGSKIVEVWRVIRADVGYFVAEITVISA